MFIIILFIILIILFIFALSYAYYDFYKDITDYKFDKKSLMHEDDEKY